MTYTCYECIGGGPRDGEWRSKTVPVKGYRQGIYEWREMTPGGLVITTGFGWVYEGEPPEENTE